jgi:hypothetical protein
MKISPEIEILSHEFARDRAADLKLAARDETSVSFFKLLREFAQRVVEVKVHETVDFLEGTQQCGTSVSLRMHEGLPLRVNDISAQHIMLIKEPHGGPADKRGERTSGSAMTRPALILGHEREEADRLQNGGPVATSSGSLPATGRVGPRASALPHGPACKLESAQGDVLSRE